MESVRQKCPRSKSGAAKVKSLCFDPNLQSIYIKVTVYTYVPFSRPNRQTNLYQILNRPPHQLREGSYHKHDPANPTPGPRGTPNSKTQMSHGRENFV